MDNTRMIVGDEEKRYGGPSCQYLTMHKGLCGDVPATFDSYTLQWFCGAHSPRQAEPLHTNTEAQIADLIARVEALEANVLLEAPKPIQREYDLWAAADRVLRAYQYSPNASHLEAELKDSGAIEALEAALDAYEDTGWGK